MLEDYLTRLGRPAIAGPTLATLAALHHAHCQAIPFESLDVLAGRTPSLALDDLAAKLLRSRRGGYCYEQNTLFKAVLERLGFTVTLLMARVRMGSAAVRPRTHALLRVEAEGRSYVADAGFGFHGLAAPLRLDAGVERHDGLIGHRLMKTGDLWTLQARPGAEWIDLYTFTLEPHYPVDLEVANFCTANYPHSPFLSLLVAHRSLPDRRLMLRGLEYSILTALGPERRTLASAAEVAAVLDGDFGLDVPDECRLPG